MSPQQFTDPLGDGGIQCPGLGHSSSMRATAARLAVMAGSSRGDPPHSICDVLPAAAALLADEVRRVAVVLVDGMGWHLLPALADDAPLLASVLAGDTGRLDEL